MSVFAVALTGTALHVGGGGGPDRGAFVFSRADVGFGINRVSLSACRLLPVCPDQQTSSDQPGWSVSCHQRKSPTLFDHLVGAAEQRRGDIDAERFSGANEPPGQLNL